MSDVSQGPGWWQALDGKWHPPVSDQASGVSVATTVAPASASATGSAYARTVTSPPQDRAFDPPASRSVLGDFSLRTTLRRRSPRKRPPVWIALVVVVVLAVGVGATLALTGSSGNGIAGLSANQVVAQATRAATKEGSVHVVVTIQASGLTGTYVNDTGTTSGEQQISASNGAHMTALLVNGVAYIRANAQGIILFFQATNTVAQRFANTWLSFGSTDPAFKAIAATLTMESLVQQDFPKSGATEVGVSDVNGQSVIGVRGQLGGGIPGTAFVTTSGSPLLVEVTSSYQGTRTSAIFSDWGEAVKAVAPTGAISGSGFESQLSPPPSQNDRAAQSNLTNALTEVKALYQNTQSYTPGGSPMTVAAVESQAPEFAWTTDACGPASLTNCVSMQVVDASVPGDGQAMVLADYSASTGDCWYTLDLENPVSSFTDSGQNLALVTGGRTPTGISTPGVFFAEKLPSPSTSASTYCSGRWAVAQARFGWGTTYSNPGAAS